MDGLEPQTTNAGVDQHHECDCSMACKQIQVIILLERNGNLNRKIRSWIEGDSVSAFCSLYNTWPIDKYILDTSFIFDREVPTI